ncbi:hypothetical protein evm_001539 [Chilo suppressalis]|nr:hypothetical protein evm_001539 [Chilo suppressalis]
MLIFAPSLEVNLSDKVKMLHGDTYFTKVLQETFYEIEERGFCNLKLVDFNQTLNETLYKWHVVGHVAYTNGFVVSIDRIALTNVGSSTFHSNAGVTSATFSATLNLYHVKVGYDVTAVLDNEGTHRFTGTFNHNHIEQRIVVSKDLATGKFVATPTTNSVSGGSGVIMVYMPENRVSEVLSRHFLATSTRPNLAIWINEIIIPIMLEKAKSIDFPDYCVHC